MAIFAQDFANSLFDLPLSKWILMVASLGVAYIAFTRRASMSTNEPPAVPHTIPWIGHGFSFVLDNNGFVEWAKKKTSYAPITSITLAGRRMYLIFDAQLACQIYRQSRTYAFDPFVLLTCEVFGSSKEDVKILEVGAHDVSRKLIIDENVGPGLLHELHGQSVRYLRGESLKRMTGVFNKHMFENIDRDFPPSEKSSYEWKEVDLVEFVRKAWTIASVISLFGMHILELWPRIYEWLWEFDENILPLFGQLPRFIIPKSYRLREEAIRMLIKWEEDALQHQLEGKMDGNPEWDPYWGLRFLRVRGKTAQESGLGPRARAGIQLALLWAQNANAIPVAVWTMIHAVSNKPALPILIAEMRNAQTGPATLDMPNLLVQPHLKSLLLETYRWATASPGVRVLQHDTELGGYTLKTGGMIYIHTRSLQTDEQIWTSSDKSIRASDFEATRFLDTNESSYEADRVAESAEAEKNYLNSGKTISKPKNTDIFSGAKDKDTQERMQALRPFGGGQTLCPGRHFASNEILAGLTAMLLKLEFEVDQASLENNGFPKTDMRKQGGLFPDRKFMVRVRRRKV